jgi:NAD(P)-dependent dehydrogenase (short-subunit alcohol dehydrogenase family)
MDTILDVAPLAMDKSGLKKDAMAGDVAVVTGGGSNIGLGISRSLAWLGVKVVIADINPETGYAAEKVINSENGPDSALFVETDVSNELSMRNMAEKAFRKFEKVDILVNNAMDMRLGAQILKTSVYALDRQYEISTRGALLGIQLFVPGMQRRKHGVVTYMSTAFRYPVGPSNYCAAKAATTSVIMSLANELGPVEDTGISVFTFIPAGIGRMREMPRDHEPSFDLHIEMPGYGTLIPPEDCGAAMAYAISRAPEIHNSGVMIQQVFRQMDWPYPQPETVPTGDFERINEMALSLVFAYMGPGFPDPKVPLYSINRSDNTEFPFRRE